MQQKRMSFGKLDQCRLNMQQILPRLFIQSNFVSIWKCGNKLRKDNLSLEKRPLEETLIIENIMEGEIEIPESFKVARRVKTNIT